MEPRQSLPEFPGPPTPFRLLGRRWWTSLIQHRLVLAICAAPIVALVALGIATAPLSGPHIWATFGVLLLGGILWFVMFVIALSTRTARARLVRCALVTLGWISLQGASEALPLASAATSPALQAMQAIGFFIVVGAFLVPISRYADDT